MKKGIVLGLILSISLFATAQIQRVKAPVPQDEFETYLEKFQMTSTQSKRIEYAMALANSKYFTCRQIKEISDMLPNDGLKLQFSLKAYERAVNPSDYYVIMDSFDMMSSAFKFHDAKKINSKPEMEVMEVKPAEEPEKPADVFPYNLPDASNYTGRTQSNCKQPISESQFKLLADQVRNVKSPAGKYNNSITIVEKYCLSVAQLMKLAYFIEDEKVRYELFTNAYTHIYDTDNYMAVRQMLETPYYNQKIMELYGKNKTEKPQVIDPSHKVEVKPNVVDRTGGDCFVETRELEEILAVLKEESFESSRVSTAQQIIKRKKCFKTEQIIRILQCFSYESSKQDMAKFAFPYVTDKTNYYKVKDVFEFDSSKSDLDEFLEKQ